MWLPGRLLSTSPSVHAPFVPGTLAACLLCPFCGGFALLRLTQWLRRGDGCGPPNVSILVMGCHLPMLLPLVASRRTSLCRNSHRRTGSTVSSPPILANVPAPPCAWMWTHLPVVGTALRWPPAPSTHFSCLSYNRRQRLVPTASTTLLLWVNNAVPYQGTECEYRHSQAILLRLQRGQVVATCPAWSGDGCSNVACPWRHPINNTGVSA